MIKRSSLLINLGMLASAVLFSAQANAALGKMRVLSKSGQPLHAEITLTGTTGITPGALRAGVIADGRFKELTISSQTQAGNIGLNIAQRGKGRVLVVKSSAPVSEPQFKFAIQAQRPSDSVTREYIVTLDTPRYSPPAEHSALYQRYSGQVVLSPNDGGLVRTGYDNNHGWRLVKVDNTSQPVTTGEASAAAASTPIDMTLAELEAQVKARDEAIQANNKRLANMEKEIEAMKQRMSQPAQAQNATPEQPANDGGGAGIVDMLMDNLMYVGLALLLLLLVVFLILRSKRSKKAENSSPALTLHVGMPFAGAATQEPKQPDVPKPMAFNQPVQQRQGNTAQATFMTDFTQMSGAIDTGEVDPIAEAEVYIAYGRDAQAEEILLDALKQDPSRHEVRMKLMELYASKSDVPHFEKLAQEMHEAFDGRGALWAKAAAMGLALDPSNPLYQMSEAPATRPVPIPSASEHTSSGLISLDDELAAADLSAQLGDEPVSASMAEVASPDEEAGNDELLSALFSEQALLDGSTEEPQAQEPVDPEAEDDQHLSFSLDSLLSMPSNDNSEPEPVATEEAEQDALLEFNLDEMIDKGAEAATAAQPESSQPVESAPAFTADFIEFELPSSASKEADDSHKVAAATAPSEDPLSTKLDLAQVYLDMGDEEGAKEVLQELLAEADGSLRDEALGMLARIGA